MVLVTAGVLAAGCEPRETKPPQSVASDVASGAVDVAQFVAAGKMETLAAPAIAPDDEDTNFSGVAYCPSTKSFMVIDNEPNAQDRTRVKAADGKAKSATVDQGDLYEYDAAGKLLRRIDLAGFDDPEAIALVGADPKTPANVQYVIAEERIGELAVISVPAYVADEGNQKSSDGERAKTLTIDKSKLAAGCVIKLTPNLVDDGNKESNDGLESIAYDADHDVFYAGKERGPNRGVYRVARDGKNVPVAIEGLFESDKSHDKKSKAASDRKLKHTPIGDIADLQYARGCLYVLSQETGVVVQVKLVADEPKPGADQASEASTKYRGEIVGQFPPVGEKKLPHRQPEGLTLTDDGRELWIIGEPRELLRYRPPMPK